MQITWTFESDFEDETYARQTEITTHRISKTASALNIPNATGAHSGTYICTVSNQAGKTVYKTSITVNGSLQLLLRKSITLLILKLP